MCFRTLEAPNSIFSLHAAAAISLSGKLHESGESPRPIPKPEVSGWFFEGSPACCQEPRITASLECHAQLRNAIYGLGVRVYGDLRRGIWDEDFWQNHDDLK